MGSGQASGIHFFICLAVIIHPTPSVHSRVLLSRCIFIGAEYRSLASGSFPPYTCHGDSAWRVQTKPHPPKAPLFNPPSQSTDAKSLNQKLCIIQSHGQRTLLFCLWL
ncbi:hypothetical protein BU16DRAFT_95783 [Lophium mytilinum]|uniref:Secreted protein n=1 Tax=Lophium mytilinum TaxID=390894 RepID=A0A6A6QL17_9PEZI|nr:hypothetical protein BU16DRAFT_95783 [Lophium mytilinum]